MIIKGVLSYQDYKKYYSYFALKNYLPKFIIMSIAFVMITTGLNMGKRFFPQNEIPFTILLSLLMSAGVTIILLILFFSRVKSMYRKNVRLKMENEYRVMDGGIGIKSERGDYLMKWSDFTQAFEHKDILFLYSNGNQAILLPSVFFQNKNDFDEFRNILKKNIIKTKFKKPANR